MVIKRASKTITPSQNGETKLGIAWDDVLAEDDIITSWVEDTVVFALHPPGTQCVPTI